MPKVTMTVRRTDADVSVINIEGEITGTAENALTDAYTQASADVRAVILNFASLEYMNSSGIGLLVTLLIRAQRHGQKLMAVGLSEHYREIFELTRLNEAISLFSNESEAIASLNTARV
jgi:anti-sigma B factor antagonist